MYVSSFCQNSYLSSLWNSPRNSLLPQNLPAKPGSDSSCTYVTINSHRHITILCAYIQIPRKKTENPMHTPGRLVSKCTCNVNDVQVTTFHTTEVTAVGNSTGCQGFNVWAKKPDTLTPIYVFQFLVPS